MGQELSLPVAVPAVALIAQLVGLGVHVLARKALRELPQLLLRVGPAVPGPRHRRAARGSCDFASDRSCITVIFPFPGFRPVAISDSSTVSASSRPAVKPDAPRLHRHFRRNFARPHIVG